MSRTIQQGIYLVIDPSVPENVLLEKLAAVVDEEIAAVQIWDNFPSKEKMAAIINNIVELCHSKNIPVLINNRWELVQQTALDGIHFDTMPANLPAIKQAIGKHVLTGITCGNDLAVVHWANENGIDYISFCSMFPSTTANSCELVRFDTIQQAAHITSLPIFLAGGIQPGNIEALNELQYAGIAVVSGIMNATDPKHAYQLYQQKIKTTTK